MTAPMDVLGILVAAALAGVVLWRAPRARWLQIAGAGLAFLAGAILFMAFAGYSADQLRHMLTFRETQDHWGVSSSVVVGYGLLAGALLRSLIPSRWVT